jgi:hypothetical protein
MIARKYPKIWSFKEDKNAETLKRDLKMFASIIFRAVLSLHFRFGYHS